MRTLQTKKTIFQSHLRHIGSCQDSFNGTYSTKSKASQSPTPVRGCSTPARAYSVHKDILKSAPVRSESFNNLCFAGRRTFGQQTQQRLAGHQQHATELRQNERYDSTETMASPLKAHELDHQARIQKHGQNNTKIQSQFQLRDSKIQQNTFELESESVDSCEENDVHQKLAQTAFDVKISMEKKSSDHQDMDDFINIYKNQFGMPTSKGNQTEVKDYLFKLLEFKQGHDSFEDSSCDEHEQHITKQLQTEIENKESYLQKDKNEGVKMSETKLEFKKVSKNRFLIIKKEENKCVFKVVFVRHGQSIWNKAGRCSGWIDVPLNDKGVQEAHDAGVLLKDLGYNFDLAYSSYLQRANKTGQIILDELEQDDLDINRAWQLNERHYGALEGRYKKELEREFGTNQVKLWRQSYDNAPPEVAFEDEYHPRFDKLYKHLSLKEQRLLPVGESLEMVTQRVTPYWQEQIVPHLMSLGPNKTMLLTAHQHTCRGFIKALTGVDNEVLKGVRIPNAAPFVFEFDQNMRPLKNYYVENEDTEVVDSNKIETKETLFMHGA